MNIGVSSYSFESIRKVRNLDAFGMIDLALELGFSAIEFIDVYAPEGKDKISHAKEISAYAKEKGIEISAYTIGADLLFRDESEEYQRLCGELEIAQALGVDKMRHDICSGFPNERKLRRSFNDALKIVAPRARKVSEFAETLGIKTMFENHGFFCQDSERVEKLLNTVDFENFGLLIDIGNFLCADEDPGVAVGKLAPYAIHVHIKDFFIRDGMLPTPGAGWFRTRAGNYLRGTVVGHGNVPVKQCLETIKNTGYNGKFSFEFEGLEDPIFALRTGLENLNGYFPQ
ncbi:MAG: sugar phosphate isomerase/epimerase [Clostridia bacterium]|nr:sugar phosphate isomerase/epimerase [Clostridia bacterium]